MTLSASNDLAPLSPGVNVEGATSHAGGLKAADDTGRGANVRNVTVHTDINVSSVLPPKDPTPKA